MNIYKITPKEGTFDGGYDTYDSAVVAAESVDEAKKIHPSDKTPGDYFGSDMSKECVTWESDSWVKDSECVDVELIGAAAPNVVAGVIVASFNAG